MKKVALFILLSLHLFAITNNVNNKKDKSLFIKTVKLADQGYTKKALKQVNLLLQINPKNPEYLLLKGNILKDLKQYEEAKIALKKVLDKEPNNIKARKLLEDIKKLENISENDVIKNALNWLGDKGIDLLFMF
jgi:tetratricopeptide (TPR) repeat protein